MVTNAELARRFEEFADLLEAKGVEYKPRAYRKAAENIREYPRSVADLAAEGESAVKDIEGVGDAIAAKVVEYVETGTIGELEDLREDLPVDVAALTAVEGVGPKTVGDLYDALGITDLDDLESAAREERIRDVSGFGEKTETKILENIPFARQSQERQLLGDARPLAEDLLDYLGDADPVAQVDVAGSLRRWRDTIGDVDVLVATEDATAVVDAFTDWGDASLVEAGTTKASVRVDDIRVDLRAVDPSEYGAALQYFTGSKDHNVHLRNVAIDRGLKMNEYGVFDVSDVEDPDAGQRVGVRIGGETEAEMYDALDLPMMAPELREDAGEIEAAAEGTLPDLVAVDAVRGDLHVHSDWSDGDETIEDMVTAAADFGHEYLAVSDHATGPGMVGGVGIDDDEIREQLAEIEDYRDDAPIPVFSGVEANVDGEGDLSVDDDLLAELDVVVASPHSDLTQDREAATDRLVAAVEHPSVDILGHPTGRLINRRPGLTLDLERLAAAAAAADTALEINANPHRLDLRDTGVRVAVEAGATVVVDTDAHRPAEFDYIRYGVHTARRGWAETDDVLNARDADGVREFFH
jgi:DNA polymerase (family 10)